MKKNTILFLLVFIYSSCIIPNKSWGQNIPNFIMDYHFLDGNGDPANHFNVCTGDEIKLVNTSTTTNGNPIGMLNTGVYTFFQLTPYALIATIPADQWQYNDTWTVTINSVISGSISLGSFGSGYRNLYVEHSGGGVSPAFEGAQRRMLYGKSRQSEDPDFQIKDCNGNYVSPNPDGSPISVCAKDIRMKITSNACNNEYFIAIHESDNYWNRTFKNEWGRWFPSPPPNEIDLQLLTHQNSNIAGIGTGFFSLDCGKITDANDPNLIGRERFYRVTLAYGPVWKSITALIELQCEKDCCCNSFEEFASDELIEKKQRIETTPIGEFELPSKFKMKDKN